MRAREALREAVRDVLGAISLALLMLVCLLLYLLLEMRDEASPVTYRGEAVAVHGAADDSGGRGR